jgi:hypothetical protein
VPRYSHRCKITTNIPFPKTARLWLAWFSADSITSTGGKGSPREGQAKGHFALIVVLQFLMSVQSGRPVFFACSEMIELMEELVGSYLTQVELQHALEFHDYDRSCQTTMHI